MGWKPTPRFDKSRKCWICVVAKRKHYLGTVESEAYQRFAEIIAGSVPTDRPGTVAEAVTAWLAVNGHKPKSWAWYMVNAWDDFAGGKPLRSLDVNHLTAFKTWLVERDKPSAVTLRHKVRVAARVLRWCQRSGYMDRVPDLPKLPKPMVKDRDLDPDTVRDVFADLPERAGRVLRFIAETGCRPGEACGLRWSDVDLRRSVAVLASHKSDRTGKPRTLYFSPAALKVLKALDRTDGHVFLSRLGTPYTVNGLRSIMRRRGVKTTYSLRHTRAQTMLDAGVPMEDVAAHLGHRDLSIVQTYARIRSERSRAVARNLEALVPDLPDAGSQPRTGTARRKTKQGTATTRRKSAKRRAG